ncbi:lysM and putative peptidoglycan-binding domain-containing protein 1 [Anoplopoma fimbria]|uniref:lysM and putative peptidoglycan-binding domain-containing protein 1 n=1 Tax=Anoplopoma fimbria TaxID=229290 RepID=UPI0023EAA249|nr:lysM and putative peptidoglycan-binding domain-containing protein 1 [Anoplopoma fimbria]
MTSGERAPLPAGGSGLLRGSRTRSYGSLVRSPLRQRCIEHNIQPEDTLPGLALKYGVSMEQIKRANWLYTNESIFLKKSLSIPVLSDSDHCSKRVDLVGEDSEGDGSAVNGLTGSSSERKQSDGTERASDLTPVDFLKRLDGLISQSKQAAVKGCQDAERRVAAIEAACTRGTSDWWPLTRSQSVILSSRGHQQQASHVAVPLTITRLTKKLRDREDEIFQL